MCPRAVKSLSQARLGAGVEVAEQFRQPSPGAGTPALDRALGDAEQPRGVGDRIALHVDGHHRGPLLDGKPHQGALHHDRRLDLGRPIGDRVDVLAAGRSGELWRGAAGPGRR